MHRTAAELIQDSLHRTAELTQDSLHSIAETRGHVPRPHLLHIKNRIEDRQSKIDYRIENLQSNRRLTIESKIDNQKNEIELCHIWRSISLKPDDVLFDFKDNFGAVNSASIHAEPATGVFLIFM